MIASSNWHYRLVVAGAQRRSVNGRCARSPYDGPDVWICGPWRGRL